MTAFAPIWWAALAVLVVNDHVLKGSGLLPGWVTGKLSDFAGLVVAPVLLATVLKGRTRSAVVAQVVAVGSCFAALKLSREAADAFESAFLALGVPCRIWTDPTDLAALAVLPLAYRLIDRSPRSDTALARRARLSRWDALGVALGGLACVATSIAPPPQGIGMIINSTHEDLRLSMREAADDLDCALLATDPRAAVAAVGLKQGTCNDLPPQEGAVIGTQRSYACGFVVLSAPGLPATALFWTDLAQRSLASASTSDADGDVRSYLHRVGDVLYLDAAPAMDTLPYPRAATDVCAGSP